MTEKIFKNFPLIKLFPTTNNSWYLYDARANLFLILSDAEKYIICEYMTLCTGSDENINQYTDTLSSEAITLIEDLQKNNILLPGILKNRVQTDESQIERLWQQSENEAVPKKLTLEITNACNLRCKYCPYTINEKKEQGKKHGTQNLKEKDACDAIKNYFLSFSRIYSKVTNEYRNTFLERNPPSIGFYGGEVLLCFSLLEALVQYTLSLPWEAEGISLGRIIFHITTNGTLLTRKMIDFFIQYNFNLVISYDGPPIENDKYRVFKNGKGAGSVVETALDMIRDISEEYLLDHVLIQSVLAPEYDHDKVNEYFKSRSINECYGGVKQFSYLEFSDYNDTPKYDKILDKFDVITQIDSIYKQNLSIDELHKQILNQPLLSTWLKYIYAILTKVGEIPTIDNNYFNSCFIGRTNLFLDTYGNLHLCERSDFSLPIGNISTGTDACTIKRIYKDYFRIMNSKKCRSCWAGRFCTLCVASLIKQGNIQEPDNAICSSICRSMEKQIEDLIYIKEHYPKILECIDSMYYQANDVSLSTFYSYIKG